MHPIVRLPGALLALLALAGCGAALAQVAPAAPAERAEAMLPWPVGEPGDVRVVDAP